MCNIFLRFIKLYLLVANVMFDCAVGEPGHGKDVEDGLNSVEKYPEKKMFRIFLSEEEHT